MNIQIVQMHAGAKEILLSTPGIHCKVSSDDVDMTCSDVEPEVVHDPLPHGRVHLPPLLTPALQPVLSKGKACAMPVGETAEDENMPPLVRAA